MWTACSKMALNDMGDDFPRGRNEKKADSEREKALERPYKL